MAFAAGAALARVASKTDAPKLADAFKAADENGKLIIVKALAQTGDAAGLAQLEAAAKSTSEPLKLSIAHELASLGNPAGVDLLVNLLASTDPAIRPRSHGDLCWITSRFSNLPTLGDAAALTEQQTQWRTILADKATILKTPLPELRPTLGRLLMTSRGLWENLRTR